MIKNYFKRLAARKRQRQRDRLAKESADRLQVREFNGELYLCHDGAPIVPEQMLNAPLLAALKHARSVFASYRHAEE